MRHGLVAGAVAGAVGTLALDVASYADMLARGRAASDLPGQAAAVIADRVGLDLGPEGDERTVNRRSALGALLGYSTGVAIGAAYGVVARRHPGRGRLPSGLGVGLAAMVAANGPMVAQGLTDPRTWGVAGWVSDVVPHVVYGLVTVGVFDKVTGRRR